MEVANTAYYTPESLATKWGCSKFTVYELLRKGALRGFRHPNWRVILASYNDETAERFARRNKEKIRNFGNALFGVEIGTLTDPLNLSCGPKRGRCRGV